MAVVVDEAVVDGVRAVFSAKQGLPIKDSENPRLALEAEDRGAHLGDNAVGVFGPSPCLLEPR
jgi:hypothetical protein